eukprot:scaffold71669_cov36-Tisochrysis_lutea.AAC.1
MERGQCERGRASGRNVPHDVGTATLHQLSHVPLARCYSVGYGCCHLEALQPDRKSPVAPRILVRIQKRAARMR